MSDLVLEKSLDFVALSGMGRRDCTPNFLKNLCGGTIFCGIVNLLEAGPMVCWEELIYYDIGEIEEGDFYVKFKLLNKRDG